jgi:hypothetical protein
MHKYNFEIKGLTTLIMHNNNIDERDKIESIRKKMKGGKPGDDRSPPESWKGYLYLSEDTSNICIPSENLLACLLAGGVKVKCSGKETLKTHSQRVMFDQQDYDLMVNGKPVPKTAIDKISGEYTEHYEAVQKLGFKLFAKPCSVGTTKHIRVRPKFANWSLKGSFEIEPEDSTLLSLTSLNDLFTTCGRLAGLGDWRPSAPKRPGQYGRFTSTVTRA